MGLSPGAKRSERTGMSRRRFVQLGGMSLLFTAAGGRGLAAPGARTAAQALPKEPLLVTIFLRGGADGLHLVPPIGDPGYAKLRGGLALDATIPFAKPFGLHPALEGLAPMIERRELAVVHAAGSPFASRSHFEAQDAMELGVAGSLAPGEGWLTRALSGREAETPFGTLALTAAQPLALRGSGAFAIGDPERFGLPGVTTEARRALLASYQRDVAGRVGEGIRADGEGAAAGRADGADPVAVAGAEALTALATYERAMGTGERHFRRRRARGRAAEGSVVRSAEQLLALEEAGLGVRAAFLECDGWDTHADQGGVDGRMARSVRDLGDGLARLAAGFGEKRDWIVVVMTEFGRTVRPNGSRGSDHGHGSAMFVAGPRVRGGLYGDWKGLVEPNLYEGRDLPVLTDWRSVVADVLSAHLGAQTPRDVFPGFVPTPLGLIST